MRLSLLAFSFASSLALAPLASAAPATDAAPLAADAVPLAAAAAVPATPSLATEFLTCSGTVADYLVSWSSAGATTYDVDYKRGGGAYVSLYDGAGKSTHFRTSASTTSVTFRARACNASGCSAFKVSGTFIPKACSGGPTP